MMFKRIVLVIAVSAVCPQAVKTLECYSCTGDECLYRVDLGDQINCGDSQQCYTKFDGYVPTERGCVSSTNPCTAGSCESCSGDYCNNLSATNHKCVICSSVLEESCVSNPGGLQAQQCSAPNVNVAETQCYSRVIGSVTERGCVQSQTDVDECDGSMCSPCAGEGCNNQEYPAGRQKCVKCSSAQCNTDAVTSYCELPGDSCVTAKKTDGTYLKTCEQSMSDADRQFCQSNPLACSFCGQNECNKIEFNESRVARQCYTCQGSDCLQSSLVIGTCHETDDQCYTIFDGFNPTQRGCRSALTTADKATCDDPDAVECNLCGESDLCNVDGRKDHQCVYCSSTLDVNCISASSPLPAIQCPAPTTEVSDDALCYTRIIGTVTERGCLGSATDGEQCDPEENCATCGGNGCNSELFPSDRRKCVVGSVIDQYCPDPWDDCVQIASNTSGGASVKKCQSSMSVEEVSFCEASSNKCDFCESDNCNQNEIEFNYLECINCNSNVDPSCASNPSTITNLVHCGTCVNILENNSVGEQILQRDCLEQLSPEDAEQCNFGNSTTSDATCTPCSTNRCNNGPFPADRLACHSCEGGSCFSHDTIRLEYCPKYQEGDSCYVQTDSAGMLVRMGCRSSLSAGEQSTCAANPDRCRLCQSAGCNDPVKYGNSGSCVQCDSVLDVSCVGRASDMDAEPCNDPLNTHCYTRLVGGSTIVRGCSSELNTTELTKCNNNEDCSVCDSTVRKCNIDIYPANRLECYTCEGGSCFTHDTVKLEYCPKYQQGDSCFVQIDSTGMLSRMGCRSSLNSGEQTSCAANPELCKTCQSTRCNDPMKYGNSGSCVQCDSALDVSCVGRASDMDAEPCNDPSNTHCYTRLVGGSTIVRGCLSELNATELTKCNNNEDCSRCDSTVRKCNVDIYPANRLECYTCEGGSCFTHDTVKLEYCPKYQQGDSCFVQIDSTGILSRMGCRSTLSAGEQSTCASNPDHCKTCQSTRCNNPMMYGNSGSCIQCDSTSDVACVGRASDMDAEPCNDPLNTHCYTRLVGGSTIARGCLSDLNTTELNKCNNNQDCSRCDSTVRKCNVDIYPANRLECYTCLQPPCFSHETISLEYCPTYSNTDQCVLLSDLTGVPIRLGCNSTLTSTEQNICRTTPTLCRYGSKSKSNDPAIILGTGKCVQCTSSQEASCMSDPAALEGTPCNDPGNTQCFSRFVDGSITERGCLNDLDAASQSLCLLSNNCALCSSRTTNCNSGQYPLNLKRCFQCDSTTNASCKAVQSGTAPPCTSYNPDNQCYIVVQKNGDTVRKCSTQPRATECAGADRCEICRFSGCNSRVSTDVMPADLGATTTTTPSPAAKPGRAATMDGANLTVAIMMMIALAVVRRLTGTG